MLSRTQSGQADPASLALVVTDLTQASACGLPSPGLRSVLEQTRARGLACGLPAARPDSVLGERGQQFHVGRVQLSPGRLQFFLLMFYIQPMLKAVSTGSGLR